MNRMAGALLGSALGGGGAAVATSAMVNTPMDQLADQLDRVRGSHEKMPLVAQDLYYLIMGQEMSRSEAEAAIQALEGSLDPTAVSVSSPGGKKAITAAMQLRQQNPALGAAFAVQAKQDLALTGDMREQGVTPEQLIAAHAAGAGTTMVPGAIAGLVGGGLGYGAGHLLGGMRRPATK